MSDKPKYTRVLLKLSGEAMRGGEEHGFSAAAIEHIVNEVGSITDLGVRVALVIGGGNIMRGAAAAEGGKNRARADYMGMLATVINALALQDAFEAKGANARVLSAIKAEEICEPYIREHALQHLADGRIVILAGGTGNPYFTTDTAAALRAIELNMDVLIKGTKVAGVFDNDPKTDPEATMYGKLPYMEALSKKLKVMDATAFSLCMDNQMPIIVCSMLEEGNIKNVILGKEVGTIVGGT